MEKQSTGRVMMKLVVSVLALFLLMACGVFMGACKAEHEHTYKKVTGEGMAATCGATGYEIYECEGCGDRYALSTYATGNHNFGPDGYCTVCGLPAGYDDTQLQQLLNDINSKIDQVQHSVNEIHVHNFSKEVFSVKATCYASGFVTRTCECGSSAITDAIDKLDHEWAAETITVPATCVSAGEVYRKCVNCEAVVLYETTSPAGHKYGTEMKTIVAATCTESGYRGYQCEVCGEMGYSEAIPATDHKMVWSTKANTDGYAANCQHGDLTWYHCENENCPENWGEPAEVSAKGGHDFGFGEKYHNLKEDGKGKAATCTEDGTCTQVCRACGAEGALVTDADDLAKKHSWERTTKDAEGKDVPFDWSKVESTDSHIVEGSYEAPRCNKVGGFTYKCTDCDQTIDYVIPMDAGAHLVVTENDSPKEIETISQLTGKLASMNGQEQPDGTVKNYHWNTVTYTHYLCEYCREWLVKTEDIPEGGNPDTPNKAPVKTEGSDTPSGSTGDLTTADPLPEYSVIKRVTFDYETVDLDTQLQAWVDAGILNFSWHGWQDYDEEAKKADGNGAVTNDYGEKVNVGDATCTADGVHWYHCIDANCNVGNTSVITPAIGHNYDIPYTLAQWEELMATASAGAVPGVGGAGHGEESMEGESGGEKKSPITEINKREDIFYGADCTDYAVVFLGCTNCFLEGKYVPPEEMENEEGEVEYEHCKGDEHGATRIAVTVRDGALTVVEMDYSLITRMETQNDKSTTYLLSDEEIARRVSDLDAFKAEYEQAHSGANLDVDSWCSSVYSADINNDVIEKLYDAFEGSLDVGTLGEGSEEPVEPSTPKLDEFKDKKYVFDPLGHVWEKEENKNTDGHKEVWDVQKPPEEDDPEDWEEDLPEETFDCTKPGYTGRWCSRECCQGETTTPAPEGEAPHMNDRHQKISLERDLNEESDLWDYAIDLHRVDKDGKEYFLVVIETEKTVATEGDDEGEDEGPASFKGELTYEEINQLFELLVEKEHNFGYRVDSSNVKCGDVAPAHVYCKNEGCDVHFEDQKREIKHIGNFGHYYTIGACGTAFGEDHSIIEYDYCLDCGKRVGLEVVDKMEDGKVVTDKDGNVVREETDNVVWTEGDINPLTGKPYDLLPCELSTARTNYRHFPFNRDMIDALLEETETVTKDDGSTETVDAPNYKLYSAIWKMIDSWYETNNDKALRASVLTGFLMTDSTMEKVEGWTARCYDCYNEHLSHKCKNESLPTYPDGEHSKEETHYFIINNGVVEEIRGEAGETEGDEMKALIEYFVRLETRAGILATADPTLSDIQLENMVNAQMKQPENEKNIFTRLIEEAGLEDEDISDYDSIQSDYDKLLQVCLATHVRVDIYEATITVCGACDSYNWKLTDDGDIFTKITIESLAETEEP